MQFDVGIHRVSSLYRVLSSLFICSRCGRVKGICEAISSLLGHETHETRRKVETGKFSSWRLSTFHPVTDACFLISCKEIAIIPRVAISFYMQLYDKHSNMIEYRRNTGSMLSIITLPKRIHCVDHHALRFFYRMHFHATSSVFFLSFSLLPLCCRVTLARPRFSHYQSGQFATRYK